MIVRTPSGASSENYAVNKISLLLTTSFLGYPIKGGQILKKSIPEELVNPTPTNHAEICAAVCGRQPVCCL